jgi:hypothetical protein
MCEVCAIFGAGEHWSDFGRARNETFPFEDIKFYRHERARRLALIWQIIAPSGLTVEDWDGEAAAVYDVHGRSYLCPSLGDIWTAVERLSGIEVDPLDDGFIKGLRHG